MKRLSYVSALVLLVGVIWVTLAYAATTYTDSLIGDQAEPVASNRIDMGMNASGDLPGPFTVVLDYATDKTTIVGGNWMLMVLKQNADGSSTEQGTLKGTFASGSIVLNNDGTVASINSALTISGGTGNYVGVTSGNGTFWVSSTQSSPPFSGALGLTF